MKLIKLVDYNPETDSMDNGTSIPGMPMYVIGNTHSVPDGYEDISTADNWDKYGYKFLDYLFYRDEINNILFLEANPNYPTINFSGWFSMSLAHRKLMGKYVLAPYQLRLTVQTEQEDKDYWFDLLEVSQGTGSNKYTGRALIVEKMRRAVADHVRKEELTMGQTQQFFKDVDPMLSWYISTAAPDFKWWLTNAAGTPYENDGFEQKSYWSEDLEIDLTSIYNGGDYVS